jgi:DUF4097 and DUF4098 domain-containing protein YvlB
MKKTLPVYLVVIIMVFFVSAAYAKEIKKDFHESFDVNKSTRLVLKHGDGDVNIQPWDKDVLDVKVHYRAEHKSLGWGGKRDFDMSFKQTGNRIEVVGNETSSGFAGVQYSNTYEYTYTIQAPRYLELILDGDDGDVEIVDWTGDIECDLDDGDIELSGIKADETRIRLEDGDIRIEAHHGRLMIDGADGNVKISDSQVFPCTISLEDGDVQIEKSKGDFKIEVDDGAIIMRNVESNAIEIEGEDGDVEIELVESNEINMDIRTDDGDVTVVLSHGVSAVFKIDVDDGGIDVDLSSAKITGKKRHWISGEIRGGAGEINIQTEDGDVELKESRR